MTPFQIIGRNSPGLEFDGSLPVANCKPKKSTVKNSQAVERIRESSKITRWNLQGFAGTFAKTLQIAGRYRTPSRVCRRQRSTVRFRSVLASIPYRSPGHRRQTSRNRHLGFFTDDEKAAANPEIGDVLNHIEAILIAAAEPVHNRHSGPFGEDVERYLQWRDDENLGLEIREMIQEIYEAYKADTK